ncbi:hypothetical protein [Halalkalicoccus subterraneus]|nr:hypothetical protein [Halalkalicoccus subterraneus]
MLAAVAAVLVYTQVEETVELGEEPVRERESGRDSDHHACRSVMSREG